MIRILQGDCREVLATLPAKSVQCCVTSPPYWGLRDYQVPATVWGGDPACDHEWGDLIKINATNHTRNGRDEAQPVEKRVAWLRTPVPQGKFCQRCNAWAGALGLEPTPDLFVGHLVEVFREVWRVLRDDGTLWMNLGDSYAAQGGAHGGRSDNQTGVGARRVHEAGSGDQTARVPPSGIKAKDLIGIPWMTAFALRADGWYLRSDVIWHKPNPMPESVTDRPTQAHEHVFLLTKSPKYFYDAEAIREEGVIPAGTRAAKGSNARSGLKDVNGRPPEYWNYTGKRNARNVWSIATQPFPDAHFATFAPELAERCIKAGTSEGGCCPACGAPLERQTERHIEMASGSGKSGRKPIGKGAGGEQTESGSYDIRLGPVVRSVTMGWQQGCTCSPSPPVPCTVLDPFGGAGTTGLVADRLKRDAVLIEVNPEYAAMAGRRLTKDAGLFAEVGTV